MMRTLREAWVGAITLLLASASWALAEPSPLDHQFLFEAVDTVAIRPRSVFSGTIDTWPAPAETPRGRADLYQHASLSFAIGLGVGIATEEPAAAGGVSISLGIAKEFMDPRFDKTDLLADLVGATLAALVTHWLSP